MPEEFDLDFTLLGADVVGEAGVGRVGRCAEAGREVDRGAAVGAAPLQVGRVPGGEVEQERVGRRREVVVEEEPRQQAVRSMS